ncbi:YoaK family protein [Phyllobacterium sp. 0TCS1.6C]|uniref:YoaK family protein n=1 Tax=unclassified Phyllobacterium TaxID=2638441 RepID=UPI0022652880|nr:MULTISPECIES: YoaK family protein [unclassified Phyllobacterium]MCX8281131.1 YoaK family protein [Phyllobacterium sp. 0TCS1.6C]MCX8294582.1 YoaK family protein [Phyllobacterium sp. 0TCS1.6A]
MELTVRTPLTPIQSSCFIIGKHETGSFEMLVNVGEARRIGVDFQLGNTLAAVAGALNAAAFHAVGFFSANMTGNVSLVSDHLATGDFSLGLFAGLIVVSFVCGAALSTLLVNAGRRRKIAGIYAYSILLEASLLVGLGFVDIFANASVRTSILVFGLSFLMGLQNAIVTRISNARIRTTHVSGMATDIGIGIGMLCDIALGHERKIDSGETASKLLLHLNIVASFLLGGLIGVAIYREFEAALLFIAAGILYVLAVPGVLKTRSQRVRTE